MLTGATNSERQNRSALGGSKKAKKNGGVLPFDILQIELIQRQGVIFMPPVGENQTEVPF